MHGHRARPAKARYTGLVRLFFNQVLDVVRADPRRIIIIEAVDNPVIAGNISVLSHRTTAFPAIRPRERNPIGANGKSGSLTLRQNSIHVEQKPSTSPACSSMRISLPARCSNVAKSSALYCFELFSAERKNRRSGSPTRV